MSKPMHATAPDVLARPLTETSVEELSELFTGNAKPPEEWMIGLELELFTFRKKDGSAADHETLAQLLSSLGRKEAMEEDREPSGALVGLRGGGKIISIEPGGQLEFATKPHRSLKAMRDELEDYVRTLGEVAEEQGLGFWAMGQHPYATRDTIDRMPKPRYDCMRSYFGNRGARALDMMHLTCSVQCTVDFFDETNLTDKVRTAARASPFISALVAASPFTAGKPNGFKSIRYQIWLETDDERCGLWPEMLDDEGLSVRRYIERALKTPALLFVRDGEHLCAEPRPYEQIAAEGFRGTTVTVADFLDHLTTFFPEIRPKGYVELRGADCLPPDGAVAIAGVWRGLLDDEATRKAVDQRLAAMSYAELRMLQPEVARLGLDAGSPAGPVREVAKWLVDTAHQRLTSSAPDCAECLEPLVERAAAGRSPADDMLALAEKTSVEEALERHATV